jgi:hypothetical protein
MTENLEWYCAECGTTFNHLAPYFLKENKRYCGDCAFKNNFIDEKTLKKDFYFFISDEILGTPIVKDNKVIFVSDSYIKKRMTKDERYTPEYRQWIKKVFERDDYTCQHCGIKGGNLNAHHILPFYKYKEKRVDINNGITLCEKCHKEIHRGKKCKDI